MIHGNVSRVVRALGNADVEKKRLWKMFLAVRGSHVLCKTWHRVRHVHFYLLSMRQLKNGCQVTSQINASVIFDISDIRKCRADVSYQKMNTPTVCIFRNGQSPTKLGKITKTCHWNGLKTTGNPWFFLWLTDDYFCTSGIIVCYFLTQSLSAITYSQGYLKWMCGSEIFSAFEG